jgi:uncharacterized membrane protein
MNAKMSLAGNRNISLQGARVFLFIALLGAGYLAFASMSGEGVEGCGPGSGCNYVMSSHWAYWMGIPVSFPAMAVYLSLLITTWTGGQTVALGDRRRTWFVVVSLGGLIVLAAGWFALLQYASIKHWCKFCLATHASALVAIGLLIRSALDGSQPASASAQGKPFRSPLFALGGLAAVFGLAILIIGQLAATKSRYTVAKMPPGALGANFRTFSLYNSQFDLDPDELPLMGSPSATNYIVSLFDYTCSHCRRLHPVLRDAVRSCSGRLAIISLPVPMDAGCNPLIHKTARGNANACNYARLSLAVWRARPAAFAEFDDWLFASDRLPPLDQARAKAEQLAGKETLAQALGNSWGRRQIKSDVELYMAGSRLLDNNRLPQLIFGDIATSGSIDTTDELMRLINRHATLNRGPSPPIAPDQPTPLH